MFKFFKKSKKEKPQKLTPAKILNISTERNSFNEPLDKKLFCTGLLQIKDSYFYSNHRGCMALWGTHWPVNDTIKYAKETVGLAISLPEEIVYGETEDSVNHLYIIKPNHITSFTYHVEVI